MQNFRAGLILMLFTILTLPLMPVQFVLNQAGGRWARRLPVWYHDKVCRLIGVRCHVEGMVPDDHRPSLLIANHVSWLDIPVLSGTLPVSFVAKSEVASWPFVASLARLQRTIFVDRARRSAAAEAARAIMTRLQEGDSILLFAEGTSSDGSRVLPFRSSLFAAVKPSERLVGASEQDIPVQTLAIAYTRRHGLPLSRCDRPLVGWYGDMELASHVWCLLKNGPYDVHIRFGEPIPLRNFPDRKTLARHTESRVRADVSELLCPRP